MQPEQQRQKKPAEASIKDMVHGHDGHIPTLIERRGGSERPLVLSVNSRKETNIEKVFCFVLFLSQMCFSIFFQMCFNH